ncbi:hypothetical protein SLEP1_g28196 [Rubroshorea leprosula]|uniref:Uncharacterized protein n=1 Tax=Rubroshorea leprosula TaxID=152421 RepID=A0AAV5JZD3_9ROSI|nr:hypothetical protein SLEP1_g28196 [Rubroshorea leprosula]
MSGKSLAIDNFLFNLIFNKPLIILLLKNLNFLL